MMMGDYIFNAKDVSAFARQVFITAGWAQRDADIAAQHLITADLSGHPSHGVGMLPVYVTAMQSGGLSAASQPADILRSGSFLVVQGNSALGQVAAADATEAGIAIARAQGMALVNLIEAFHIGRIGHYAEMAAAAGLIGLFWVNVSGGEVVVVPWGGREARYSTNPHAIGIPRAGGQPFLLDFATSQIAHGKTRVAHLAGKKLAPGLVVDHRGLPTDDPGVMWTEPMGGLAPMGLHKGYGMALAAELLASILGGGATIADSRRRGIINNSMLAILIDPARFAAVAGDWQARAERYLAWVTSAPPAPGSDKVRVPGDPEFEARAAAQGKVRYPHGNWTAIAEAGRSIGLPPDAIPAPIETVT